MSDQVSRGFDLDDLSASRVALESIRRRPGPFVAAIFASWSALLVAFAVVASSATVDRLLSRVSQSVAVMVVLRDSASLDQVEAVRKALAGINGSGLVSTPDEGSRLGLDDLGLKQLPSIVRVSAGANAPSLATWVRAVRRSLETQPAVQAIRVDEPWIQSLDRWRSQWALVKPWFSGIAAAILGLFLALSWFLQGCSQTEDSTVAGAYIALLGIVLAIVGCACLGGLVLLRFPDELASLDDEWRLNSLFVIGFSVILALAGAKAAAIGR